MYKWNAEDYHQNSSEQQRLAQEAIAKLGFQGNERILDIGCGDGKITVELAALVPNGSVVGIDSSAEMIAFAKSKFPASSFPNLSFQQGDAKNLNFENEFDAIVSFNCLHWIKDHLAVLAGIKKSLKPDGKIYFLFAGKTDNNGMSDLATKLTQMEKWQIYLQNLDNPYGLYTKEEYERIVDKVGLKALNVDAIATKMAFKDRERFKGLIRTTWLPLTERIPKNLHQELIDDIANLYLEINPPDENGFVYLPMMKLEVEATKLETSDP